jgi:hypothetical protein
MHTTRPAKIMQVLMVESLRSPSGGTDKIIGTVISNAPKAVEVFYIAKRMGKFGL